MIMRPNAIQTLLLLLLICAQVPALAQGQGTYTPAHGTMERSFADTVFVPPGMAYSASYYCWSDDGSTATGNWVVTTPVTWLEPFTLPLGQTSTNCDDLYVIRYRVHAPEVPGVYEAQFEDLNGIWDAWTLRIKVGDVPGYVDATYQSNFIVSQLYQYPVSLDGTSGVSSVGCPPSPYLPATDFFYEIAFHPAAPWVSVSEDSIPMQAGVDGQVIYSYQSAVPGPVSTYVYLGGSWYGWPSIYKLDAEFSTGFSIANVDEANGALHATPNPVDAARIVRVEVERSVLGTLTLTDVTGRLVLSERMNGNTHVLDLSSAPAGSYLLTLHTEQGVTCQRVVVE